MSRFFLFLLIAFLAAPGRAQPAQPAACRVVVLNLLGKNLPDGDEEVPALLTETLANEVDAVSGCQVITQADVAQMLDYEAARVACSDDADSCLSEIGAALGAGRVIGGTLGKLGADFVLTARLMNVEQGVVEARTEQVVPGAVEELRLAAKNAGRALFHQPVQSESAPPVTLPSPPPAQSATPTSPLLFAGAVVAGLGVVTAGVGGVFAGLSEARLADPAAEDKTAVAAQGQTALAVAVVGAVAGVAGLALVAAAFVME